MTKPLLGSIKQIFGVSSPEVNTSLLQLDEQELELIFYVLHYGMSSKLRSRYKVHLENTTDTVLQKKCKDYLSSAAQQCIFKDGEKYNLKMDVVLVKFLMAVGKVCKNDPPRRAMVIDGLANVSPKQDTPTYVPEVLLDKKKEWSHILAAAIFAVVPVTQVMGTKVHIKYEAFEDNSPALWTDKQFSLKFPRTPSVPPKHIDF